MVRPVSPRAPSSARSVPRLRSAFGRTLRRLAAGLASIASAAAFAAVDANTASAEALEAVSGIGPAIAKRIVDERRKGPYRSLDDLQVRVKGIGEAKARRLAAAGLTVGPGSSAAASSATRSSTASPTAAAASSPGASTGDASVPRAPVRVIVGGQGAPRP